MTTLTIRLPEDKYSRLKQLAQLRGISMNKLIKELSTIALAEFDTYNRFKLMVARGNPQTGLALFDKLDTLSN